MTKQAKSTIDQLSLYVSKKFRPNRIIERLILLADRENRSISQLGVIAILEYIEKQEAERKQSESV